MATIRITCPTCGKMLEVGAEFDGQEVECGECFQVFVARESGGSKSRGTPSASGKAPASKPKSPGRRHDDPDDDYDHDHRREEYDDEDYQPPRAGRYEGGGGGGGASAASAFGLVVGILALLTSCCPISGIILGILAMVLGAAGKKSPGSAGTGTAAVVLGSIAFLISAAVLVWFLAVGGFAKLGN